MIFNIFIKRYLVISFTTFNQTFKSHKIFHINDSTIKGRSHSHVFNVANMAISPFVTDFFLLYLRTTCTIVGGLNPSI